MTTTIDHNDFSDILDLVEERLERWGEELHDQGWRGSIGLLLEGYPEDGYEDISPLINGRVDLERGEPATPIKYDPEYEYRGGTDDTTYPINEINDMLLTYTGERPYWYDLGMRITPEDGTRLRVIG